MHNWSAEEGGPTHTVESAKGAGTRWLHFAVGAYTGAQGWQPLVAVAGGSLGFFSLGAQGSSDSAMQGST